MANYAQEHVNRRLGPNQGQSLDYSQRQLRRAVPANREEFRSLIIEANTLGPNSAEYADLMTLYQRGYDLDHFADTSNAGVPRSIHDTAEALADAAETSRQYFTNADPLLHQYQVNGRTLAELGPEQARQMVAMAMVDATAEQRPALLQLQSAVDNSMTSSLGISWTTPDQPLEYTARSSGAEADPSGYTQWREGQAGVVPGLAALQIRARTSDALFDGLSMSGTGGTYDHYEAQQMAAVRSGNLNALALDSQGMHQGDAGNISQGDVIHVQG